MYERGRPGYAPEVAPWLGQRQPLRDALEHLDVRQARSQRELARVLKPGGGLAIVWNIGRETEPPTPELEAFVAGLRAEAGLGRPTATEEATWRAAFDASDRFAPLRFRELRHTRHQDRETFVAYLASLAFVAAMPERAAAIERIRELAPETSVLSLRTECYWTRRRDPTTAS